MANSSISPERKSIYQVGILLSIVGGLLFLSTFVSFFSHFGDFSNFEARGRSMGLRAFGGMVLLMAGGVLCKTAARGVAGSGLVLDPEQAREDLKPWNKAGGGMINDALSEIDVVKKIGDRLEGAAAPAPTVKVRCRQCSALNDESAKYCNQCGAAV
ncbi:MAG: zinc ribbon domain-containing protein [Singulisphaera sp.]